MVVIAVIGIAVAVAVPNIVGYMPEYRLKRAARDLYSAMQSTKMGAIKITRAGPLFLILRQVAI